DPVLVLDVDSVAGAPVRPGPAGVQQHAPVDRRRLGGLPVADAVAAVVDDAVDDLGTLREPGDPLGAVQVGRVRACDRRDPFRVAVGYLQVVELYVGADQVVVGVPDDDDALLGRGEAYTVEHRDLAGERPNLDR